MPLTQLQTYIALLVAGAALPLSLAPFSLWPIAIASMAALFMALQNQSAGQAFKRATIYGFGLFGAGASWVYVSMYNFGGVSMLFAIIGTLLFCLLFAILFALPFICSAWIPQSAPSQLLGLPTIWVISEWFRSWILTGFPWLYAGYSHTDTWLNGWAPIGGVLLLSYFSAVAAALLVQLLQRRLSAATILSGCLVIAVFIGGCGLQKVSWTEAVSEPLSVALVQPNVNQKDRWGPDKRNKALKDLLAQTEPHWDADIIIWPESAIPALKSQIPDYLMALDKRGKLNQTALITGIPTDTIRGRYHNSMLAVGDAFGQYDKTRLVPFGEYVPIESLVRGLNNFFDLPMSSFALGEKNQSPLVAKGQKISTAICYEIVYPDLVSSNSRDTSILLTTSNDAWFGDSIAPQQHMQMARMRAIENAKPLMRGTNNGITALVDHKGTIYRKLEQFSTGVLTGQLVPRTGETPFNRLGSWPIIIFSLLVTAALVISAIRQRKIGVLK